MTTPRTAAGRALLDGYHQVVTKRPDVDGILSLHAVLTIEAEARSATVEQIRAALSEAIDANMLHWLAWDDVSAILDEVAA